MRPRVALLLAGLLGGILGVLPVGAATPGPTPVAPTATPVPPRPTATPVPPKPSPRPPAGSGHSLSLHKAFIPPEWGRVIQYHRELVSDHSLFNRGEETVHEFVLQAPDGIVRNAFYHEPSSGNAYWVVWVWDQP